MYNQCIFYNIKNFWLKLTHCKNKCWKKLCPIFLIANHKEFGNIFSTKYWVGCLLNISINKTMIHFFIVYRFLLTQFPQSFFLQLVGAGIFLFTIALQEFFFQNHPPQHQKLNGQPLTKQVWFGHFDFGPAVNAVINAYFFGLT